jgi:ATP-dependent DNA helicase RecG
MILNALIHRNYMGAHTQLRVYDNKLFLWNHGTLPEGITLAELIGRHSSFPRNPALAEACFKGGFIDAWGSGTIKIIDACKVAGLPEPTMEEKWGGFIVTLFKERFSVEELQKMGLNERQVKAVVYVKEKGKITNSEYQTLNEISERTASRELEELKKLSVFKRIGDRKTTLYQLEYGG